MPSRRSKKHSVDSPSILTQPHSIAWYHILCISETVTPPWVFSTTWRTPCFLWSSQSVKVWNMVSSKIAFKALLHHKARHKWVMNCTHAQDCFPKLDSVCSVDCNHPCELKLHSKKAWVSSSCQSELSHSRALLWEEVLFNYKKLCTKKLQFCFHH